MRRRKRKKKTKTKKISIIKDNDSSSNKNTFILKDGNKDRAVNMLNNNYKINNFTNFTANNNNNNDNENTEDEKKDNNDENNNNANLGLGFAVIKQKKQPNKEKEKDSPKISEITTIYKLNLNTMDSNAKESSMLTNNKNKKLNQFISQIEHMKKIDDIKKTIIEAIHSNNKYIMDLFEKFQKK